MQTVNLTAMKHIKVMFLMETPGGGYILLFPQGDHGFPGERGPPGQKGVGEPGAKVRPKRWM